MKETLTKITPTVDIRFLDSPIDGALIGQCIAQQQRHLQTGAYNIFLGQVRRDEMENTHVGKIEYTSFREMALPLLASICRDASEAFSLHHITIYHSMGDVSAGEICLFVMCCGGHRKESFESCAYVVERIKKEVPIWGKELLENETHSWKVNKF